MDLQEVLDKYFKDGKHLYFQSSDKHQQVEGDTYLRYEKNGGVLLWFGGSNGEVCIKVTTDGAVLESVIRAIIF